MDQTTKTPKLSKPTSSSQAIVVVLVILLIITGLTAIYYYKKAKAVPPSIADSQAALQIEVNTMLENVGKLIVLPETEKPVIATVSEPEKLQDQAFFAKAQVGDKVIIYPEARKAILYRPSINKIIEVAPLNIGTAPVAEGESASDTEAVQPE